MRIHIGHHFFGAGNAGDDLMLAGFLCALRVGNLQGSPGNERLAIGEKKTEDRQPKALELTCCTPFAREGLKERFPEIEWLPYDEASRIQAIVDCDVWLGLGGSPWQSAVSRWFIDHLEQERRCCKEAGRPMYFLGVGGQDRAAYELPETRKLCEQARGIWTRDAETAASLLNVSPQALVHEGSDLAHIFLEKATPTVRPGRLVTVFNLDYGFWAPLPEVLRRLRSLETREYVWLVQETRELPGSELSLFNRLAKEEQSLWKLLYASHSSMKATAEEWPCGEWQIGSRFHSTLVAAWAGSRILVLETNRKLHCVAFELGIPSLPLDADPSLAPILLRSSMPVDRHILKRMVNKARQSCSEFFAAILQKSKT